MFNDRLTDSPERVAAAARIRAGEARNSMLLKVALVGGVVLIPAMYFMFFGGDSVDKLKLAIRDRAMIEHTDDFTAGLGKWDPAAAETWAIDPAGSVRPARLALFRPTASMVDYQMEFHTQIETKSLEFAIRAVDENNYWAVRLGLSDTGPNPRITIAHWAVVDGKQRDFRELPVPMSFRPDSLLRLWASAQGAKMQVAINGQLSDYWDDTYFKKGGVGFFATKGSTFRVMSVRVWDKDDFLGQICYRLSANSADSKLPIEP